MSKTAAFTLTGLNVNNPNLPILTPLVEGIQFRYRMAEIGQVGLLSDSSPENNDGIIRGSLSVGATGITLQGNDSEYVDTQVSDSAGDFTTICVASPAKISAGVAMGNFELDYSNNYRAGFNLWFTKNSSGGAVFSPAIAIQRSDDEAGHQNIGLAFDDPIYSEDEWCLCVFRHQPSIRRVSGFFKKMDNLSESFYDANFSYFPGENIWLGRTQGGYSFSGKIAYSVFWSTYLDDSQIAEQIKSIRKDLARRGIFF